MPNRKTGSAYRLELLGQCLLLSMAAYGCSHPWDDLARRADQSEGGAGGASALERTSTRSSGGSGEGGASGSGDGGGSAGVGGSAIHEMGGAMMGHDPRTSVTNRWNQLHDVPNVFVTDGAAMASSACQNPSLTYMAMTARACDTAVKLLKEGRI